ncbi:hypothetical protein BGZ57DRAFT_808626, partial [Hyaloscypha finlandica]
MADEEISETVAIYDRARECERLFDRYLSVLQQASHGEKKSAAAIAKDHQERFWAWATGLGVYAKPYLSLDWRLKDSPSIQELVILLLDLIKVNLSEGRSIRQLDLDPLDFNFHASRPTYLEIVRRGIEESLDRLDRLSVAIRQSSEASRARRVQNYLESHLDPHFETLIDNILRCLWPSAECSLLKQLQKSIVFRRARILYQQDCQNRLQAERTPQDDFETLAVQAQNEGERKEDFEQHGGHSEGRMASATAIHTHEPKSRTTQSVMESKKPSTVDEDIFKNKYVENAPSKSGTSLVSVAWADGFPYPPPPKPSAGKNGAKCTICFRPYMEISFRNETWWKHHVKQDIEPYTCISEDCTTPPLYFSSYTRWLRHMETVHRSNWIRHIHAPLTWGCVIDHDKVHKFASDTIFYKHLETNHPAQLGELGPDEIPVFVKNSRIPTLRDAGTCPICNLNVAQ